MNGPIFERSSTSHCNPGNENWPRACLLASRGFKWEHCDETPHPSIGAPGRRPVRPGRIGGRRRTVRPAAVGCGSDGVLRRHAHPWVGLPHGAAAGRRCRGRAGRTSRRRWPCHRDRTGQGVKAAVGTTWPRLRRLRPVCGLDRCARRGPPHLRSRSPGRRADLRLRRPSGLTPAGQPVLANPAARACSRLAGEPDSGRSSPRPNFETSCAIRSASSERLWLAAVDCSTMAAFCWVT